MTCRVGLTVCAAICLTVSAMAVSDGDSDPPATTQPAVPGEVPKPVYEYVGSKRCRMCHGQWYKSWRKSAKGDSFELLKPRVGREDKLRVGLDPEKDYTIEATCLSCHTVGFGQPGGYAIPAGDDAKAARFAATREGVGCEACPGPGGGFTQVMADVYRKERPYEQIELRRAGLRTIEPTLCLGCHTTTAPCIPEASPPLKIDDESMRSGHGFHEHFPLKYRKR